MGELGLEPVSWDAALDRAEELLRDAGTRTVTALSGSETRRAGLRARTPPAQRARRARRRSARVDLDALDAFRLPLSSIAEAEIVVIVGDDDVADRAPVVDLWLKAARRNGAEIVHYGPTGTVPTGPGGAAAALRALRAATSSATGCAPASARSSSGPAAGAGAAPGSPRPRTRSGSRGSPAAALPSACDTERRGVAAAWAAAADEDDANPEPIGLLIVSGDEAAADPAVRALAERAENVIAITMFHGLAVGWADLVLPATARSSATARC